MAYRPGGPIIPHPQWGETWLKAGRGMEEIPLQAVTERQVLPSSERPSASPQRGQDKQGLWEVWFFRLTGQNGQWKCRAPS